MGMEAEVGGGDRDQRVGKETPLSRLRSRRLDLGQQN